VARVRVGRKTVKNVFCIIKNHINENKIVLQKHPELFVGEEQLKYNLI